MCEETSEVRRCRVCGCTDDDCRQCLEAQGFPCHWVGEDLCSRCSDGIRKGLLGEMKKRGESIPEYKDFIKAIERVAPNYHYYYINGEFEEVPFTLIYSELEKLSIP